MGDPLCQPSDSQQYGVGHDLFGMSDNLGMQVRAHGETMTSLTHGSTLEALSA